MKSRTEEEMVHTVDTAEASSSALRAELPTDIVGHKTMADGSHLPLTRAEADALWASIEERDRKLAEAMPDVRAALDALTDAHCRLTQLGWKDAIYCPKDGTPFEVIECGSSGIHVAHYEGTWPKGSWWVREDGDLWPSRPTLYRPLSDGASRQDQSPDAASGMNPNTPADVTERGRG